MRRRKVKMQNHFFGGRLKKYESKKIQYKVKPLQEKKAKTLGVIIKPSTRKNKKIDVYNKQGDKLASIGGVRDNGIPYMDYASYIIRDGKKEADKKRKNYLARHSKEPKTKNGKKTNSYYADKILW